MKENPTARNSPERVQLASDADVSFVSFVSYVPYERLTCHCSQKMDVHVFHFVDEKSPEKLRTGCDSQPMPGVLAFDARPSANVGSQQRESNTDWKKHRDIGACPI